MTEITPKLALQRIALAAYHPDAYDPATLTDHSVEEEGDLDGDTLALFRWREVGDARGDCDAAILMLDTALRELEQVRTALYKEKHLLEQANG